MIGDTKYIISKGRSIELIERSPGRWFDAYGSEFALRDASASVDEVDRCGVGIFSLPESMVELNEACRVHDYKYSSRTYQAYHTREEADADLERDILLMSNGRWWGVLAKPFRFIASKFGMFWEEDRTR